MLELHGKDREYYQCRNECRIKGSSKTLVRNTFKSLVLSCGIISSRVYQFPILKYYKRISWNQGIFSITDAINRIDKATIVLILKKILLSHNFHIHEDWSLSAIFTELNPSNVLSIAYIEPIEKIQRSSTEHGITI